MTSNLAIIIPAYKEKFLEKSLTSLANQTNKNFNVYIGDDNSPSDLISICNKFTSLLNINYIKFENNVGSSDIVAQWIRCIELSKNEKWIWLFSDDDIADNNCVEEFYSIIEQDQSCFDVYRFNTRVIDDNDNVTSVSQESPFIDSATNMAFNILLCKRGNSMPDHIFSRQIYLKYGFVKTDWAQGADWGTSILFSSDKGICTIPHAKISWRLGHYNISGTVEENRSEKIRGHLQFLHWVMTYFKFLEHDDTKDITYYNMLRATDINLLLVIKNHYKGVGLANYFDLYKFYRAKNSFVRAFYKVNRLYFRINR